MVCVSIDGPAKTVPGTSTVETVTTSTWRISLYNFLLFLLVALHCTALQSSSFIIIMMNTRQAAATTVTTVHHCSAVLVSSLRQALVDAHPGAVILTRMYTVYRLNGGMCSDIHTHTHTFGVVCVVCFCICSYSTIRNDS